MDAIKIKTAIVRRQLIDTLMSREGSADLVFKNGQIINVLTREIYPGDIAVKDRLILKVGDASDLIGPQTNVIEVNGKYLAPGFIDSHMHFESSMLTVTEFSRLSLPNGVTTLVADPHEIGNALGSVGIKAMADESEYLPNHVFWVVPCLTPDSPGLETTGYNIGVKEMEKLLSYKNVIGIGELQGFSNARNVYKNNPAVLDDLVAATTYARDNGKVVDGNAPQLFGSELAAHIICTGGRTSCHETTNKEEMIEKLRYGVYVFMREGSTQRNMSECIKAITEEGLDSRRCILATDDMMAEDLEKFGHMNDVVRRVIQQGIDPVEAIQMVTINPAEYFGFENLGVLAPGKQADIVVLSDLATMKVAAVYVGGESVAENGKLIQDLAPYCYPDQVKNSIQCKPVTAQQLEITAAGNRATIRAIKIIPDQNLTGTLVAPVAVSTGAAVADLDNDLLMMVCVERYGKSSAIGKCFVNGMGLKCGAIAESVAHDAHNILCVGTNYTDMATAINHVRAMQGGLTVVKNGKILGELALPVGGLMTDLLNGHELSVALRNLHDLVRKELGCGLHAPFMHLSFLALTTSPAWKLTNRGLIDVDNYQILAPVVSQKRGEETMGNWVMKEKVFIPPYEGRSVLVKKGEELRIVDVEGKQVGDFICFNKNDRKEHVSTVHMRSSLSSIRLKVGDFLYSNYRNHLMQLVEDTVGKHDFFFPACDYYRYKVDFGIENHPNCRDNLINALKKFDLYLDDIPDPINWFMNNDMDANGDYQIREPLSKAGDYVRLRALTDVIVAVSACSQDQVPVNGMKVTPLELQVMQLTD